MKISEVRREYQLQEWGGMLRERKESGLSVKAWCAERGIAEHVYYYWLRQLRQIACKQCAGTGETGTVGRDTVGSKDE